MKLLSKSNTKIMKGEEYGYLTFGLHLAPADLSGYNTCPKASAGCKSACLNTAGMGKFSNVQKARIAKTKMFFEQREAFMKQLVKDIQSAQKAATKAGLKLAIRLNLTSDIRWEEIPVTVWSVDQNYRQKGKTNALVITDHASIIDAFSEVQFYDYTKLTGREVPSNYHLTFSKSESNDVDVDAILETSTNLAVVFNTKKGKPLPQTYRGRRVVDGDIHDIRFLDGVGVVVGLRAKGDAKSGSHDGFVVDASPCGPLYQIEMFSNTHYLSTRTPE